MSRIFKHVPGFSNAEPYIIETIGAENVFPITQGGKDTARVGGNREAIEREAYEKGFKAGEKAGFELGRQKAEVLFSGIGKILDELVSYKESLYKPCINEMVDLSLSIARKVIHRELELKEDSVLDCVKAALKAVVAGGDITVKVNPKDFEVIRQHKGELIRYGDGIKNFAIENDEKIARGGCLIDTRFGEVDATMESALEEIGQRLKDAN